jgi:hypothetical protein
MGLPRSSNIQRGTITPDFLQEWGILSIVVCDVSFILRVKWCGLRASWRTARTIILLPSASSRLFAASEGRSNLGSWIPLDH